MRKLWIVLAAVFAASVFMTAGVDAAKCPTRYKARHHIVTKHKAPAMHAKVVKKATPARAARGPVVTCPAPVVNVPQQAAPVVNVPAQPAPVVNVGPMPPTVGITVDDCSIFIVRENQLIVLDKNTYEVKKTVPLQ